MAKWLEAAEPGDDRIAVAVAALADLSSHRKWEIRRAVANAASQLPHPGFDVAVSALITDENAQVRRAAETAIVRRRDGSHTSLFGMQHQKKLDTVLDGIEGRFGIRGREAVRKAAEEIANTFAREFYHEVIKLLSPLSLASERLREELGQDLIDRGRLSAQATTIEMLVERVRSVMSAMREYGHIPTLEFSDEDLTRLALEAADVASIRGKDGPRPAIEFHGGEVRVEVDRSRLLQALTNVVANAVESYDGVGSMKAIEITATANGGTVRLSIRDFGKGMSAEGAKDARELFVTTKRTGTGFGLPLAIKIIEEEHGGRLDLNTEKGVGTEVRIALPSRQSQRLR